MFNKRKRRNKWRLAQRGLYSWPDMLFLDTPMNHCSPSPFHTFSTQPDVHIVMFTNCRCLGAVFLMANAHRVVSWLTSKMQSCWIAQMWLACLPTRFFDFLPFTVLVMDFKHLSHTAHIIPKTCSHACRLDTLIITLHQFICKYTRTNKLAATWNAFWRKSSIDLVLETEGVNNGSRWWSAETGLTGK